MTDRNVNPYIMILGFFDLLFICINSIIKNNVNIVEPMSPKGEVSEGIFNSIFSTIETIIINKENKANVLISFSFNKSSGSISSSGDFFLIISFKILNISLSISVIIFPLYNYFFKDILY